MNYIVNPSPNASASSIPRCSPVQAWTPCLISAILSYVSFFSVSAGRGRGTIPIEKKGVTWCGLIGEAEDLVEEEAKLLDQHSDKADEYVKRFLMMSVDKRLPIDKIAHFRWSLGLPYDFKSRWIHKYLEHFKVIKLDDIEYLELVSWNPDGDWGFHMILMMKSPWLNLMIKGIVATMPDASFADDSKMELGELYDAYTEKNYDSESYIYFQVDNRQIKLDDT
ncbi:hypothetical protein Taro_044849 [Colocasia esculenta]|uniref:PORR domain-containing protein n=1 Tax=Colocasia esculenta TaxID=4460 RepID=A0A843WV22_COLES|nr:hypothetical protein [Colocasia esculenta]